MTELAVDMECLGSLVRRLNQDVRGMEGRQVLLDRRLVELGSQVQSLQEESSAQSSALERGQRTVAAGATRALSTAVHLKQQLEAEGEWNKCLEGLGIDEQTPPGMQRRFEDLERRFEEQQQWVFHLLQSNPGNDSGLPPTGRLESLERAHKALASGTRRALQKALVLQEKQEIQIAEDEFEKCLELPVGELEQQCSRRFAEQDDRIEKILKIVDVLTDRVSTLKQGGLSNGHHGAGAMGDEELRYKVDEIEANLYGLAAQVQSQSGQVATLSILDQKEQQAREQRQTAEGFALVIESLEARLDRSLADVMHRLDVVQEIQDEQQVQLRSLNQQLPELSKRVDGLWTQCKEYFPRIQEQEVHFSFLRSSFEAHKQQMLELGEAVSNRLGDGKLLGVSDD